MKTTTKLSFEHSKVIMGLITEIDEEHWVATVESEPAGLAELADLRGVFLS